MSSRDMDSMEEVSKLAFSNVSKSGLTTGKPSDFDRIDFHRSPFVAAVNGELELRSRQSEYFKPMSMMILFAVHSSRLVSV